MKTQLTLAALAMALAAVGPAIAQDSGKRAEVKKVAQQPARTAADIECPPITERSTRSRQDVGAEGKAAMKSGEGKGDADCPVAVTPQKSTKARADVKAEATKAVKAGEVGKGEADVKK